MEPFQRLLHLYRQIYSRFQLFSSPFDSSGTVSVARIAEMRSWTVASFSRRAGTLVDSGSACPSYCSRLTALAHLSW